MENVVQMVMNNAATYASAEGLIMERHPTMSWTSCAAHYLDLVVDDTRKIGWVISLGLKQ